MRRYGFAVVRGRSMEPTLHEADRLLVQYDAMPRIGQIAVVKLPERDGLAVKRVTRREADGWWVERDNPAEGVDSWLVGEIPDDDLVAVAIARVWPRPRRLRARSG